MSVFVLSKEGKPLMPCEPAVARLLLKDGHAFVKKRVPFTLKLLHETTTYVQPVVACMDTGSKTLGCAATANGKVVYQSEVTLRQDVSGKMQQRHVAAGDYQQTKEARSEKPIPTGKLFGLRKHDQVKTQTCTGFVKGKRSSGYFALETIHGETVTASANVKQNVTRLTARNTTLIERTIA